MNRRVIGVAVSSALLGSLATACLAQGQGGFGSQGGFPQGARRGGFGRQGGQFGRQGGQFGGPGGQFGGPGGPFGMMMRGGMNDRDPLVTHVFELINRSDVQTAIKQSTPSFSAISSKHCSS